MADESLFDRGGRVVSVFGPFGSRALVDLPASVAAALFGGDLGLCAPSNVVDSVQRDLDVMPDAISGSALAATALALAREIEHPYNSATSKSMCAKALMDALATLRDLAPRKQEADGVTKLSDAREARLARVAASANPAGP